MLGMEQVLLGPYSVLLLGTSPAMLGSLTQMTHKFCMHENQSAPWCLCKDSGKLISCCQCMHSKVSPKQR